MYSEAIIQANGNYKKLNYVQYFIEMNIINKFSL